MQVKTAKKKVLFLYFGNHWSHQTFANAVDAVPHSAISTSKAPPLFLKPFNFLYWASKLPTGYDVYLCEETYVFPAIKKELGLLGKSKIIDIVAGSLMYYLYTKKINRALRPMYVHLMKQVDGFICISKMEEELVCKLCPTAKTSYIPQHIKPEVRKRILSGKPAMLTNHKIVMIAFGHSVYYKGLDLAVETFLKVKKSLPDAELIIIGKWTKEIAYKYSKLNPDVHFTGVVHDIVPIIKDCSLSIHIARGEGFGINIIETMLAGVPTIVSNATGAKEAVEQVNKKWVVPLDTNIAAKRVVEYFQIPNSKKIEFARKGIKVASKYTKDRSVSEFKKAYFKFVKD